MFFCETAAIQRNVKAIFKPVNHTENELVKHKICDSPQLLLIIADTSIQPQTSSTEVTTRVMANHYIMVSNQSKETHKYSYRLGICADRSWGTVGQCAYYYDEFELEPTGKAEIDAKSELQNVFTSPGKHSIYSFSKIDSLNRDIYYDVNHQSAAWNMITISDQDHMKG
ncbi:MAG: hypothetical protein ACYCQI_15425 [Gammaproteobacteria bacterium]